MFKLLRFKNIKQFTIISDNKIFNIDGSLFTLEMEEIINNYVHKESIAEEINFDIEKYEYETIYEFSTKTELKNKYIEYLI